MYLLNMQKLYISIKLKLYAEALVMQWFFIRFHVIIAAIY